MKSKVLLATALLLILISASLFTYPEVSKQVVQGQNDIAISRFDKTAGNVQGDNGDNAGDGDGSDDGNGSSYSTYEEAAADGAVNDEGYLINDYGEVISDYPVVFQKDLDRLYRDSAAYNAALNERQDMDVDFSVSALDLTNYGVFDGIYGYISAPSIGLNIPIFLGAGEYNMACGGAHLYHTSLPLGGESTNTVIAGHTGYFGMIVFDYLPLLSEGDIVSVTTYFDTLDYRVTAQKEITATETNDLYISKGKDLLTLITCARMGKTRCEVICERA